VAQIEWAWIRDWTAELVGFVLADEAHGTANRDVLAGWIDEWLPEANAAADALEPVFAELHGGPSFAEVRANVEQDRRELFETAGAAGLAGVAR
jgi:hypothetical protein